MIDVVFDLEGSTVPENYPFRLWSELTRVLPALQDEENAGVIPLRGSVNEGVLLLPRRSKLILRVPIEAEARVSALSGNQLDIGNHIVKIGACKSRPLQASPTLHTWMVQSELGEIDFVEAMRQELQAMQIKANLICDKYRELKDGENTLRGFGLVLHDLKPQASVDIQAKGLSGARHWGCGIFVPFKAITGLE